MGRPRKEDIMEIMKRWLNNLVPIGMSLITLGVVVQLAFGTKGVPFWGIDVIGNIMGAVVAIGNAGPAGLIVVAILVWLFNSHHWK